MRVLILRATLPALHGLLGVPLFVIGQRPPWRLPSWLVWNPGPGDKPPDDPFRASHDPPARLRRITINLCRPARGWNVVRVDISRKDRQAPHRLGRCGTVAKTKGRQPDPLPLNTGVPRWSGRMIALRGSIPRSPPLSRPARFNLGCAHLTTTTWGLRGHPSSAADARVGSKPAPEPCRDQAEVRFLPAAFLFRLSLGGLPRPAATEPYVLARTGTRANRRHPPIFRGSADGALSAVR
ncbi:hypothetical protein OpiT1DRAFT_05635 [Opitutaceae bacterium TAV1]|nr:hypothetical protein OpiT1DRAFT_05635 [Opitutaceae bacterium TAV1]